MPLRDDWLSAAELIKRIDKALPSCRIEVVLVDDASIRRCVPEEFHFPYQAVRAIRVLRLRRNLGHQRAIAIGLTHLQRAVRWDAVVVMDADGEDTPEGVQQLVDAYQKTGAETAVFAARSRRSESLSFRFFYYLYRALHRALTGISVRVGNFSILPPAHLETIVVLPELWNHYAAAIFRSKLPFRMIPIPRGKRLAGGSTMNFVSLVSHGLSAISVFGDIVGVRLLISSLAGSILAAVGIIAVAAVRFFTDRAIPGWATQAAGILVVIAIQFITIATSFTMFVLSSRMNLGFVPLRDHALFISEISDIYSHE